MKMEPVSVASARKARLRRDASRFSPAYLSAEELEQLGIRAQERMLDCFPPAAGQRVALYSAMPGEVPTDRIAEAIRSAGGTVYYPHALPDGELSFHPLHPGGRFVNGKYGISVPEIATGEDGIREGFHLVVVPALAFDKRGYRLGRGGGYYDRFLSRPVSAHVAGLAYSWQLVPEVPTDPWDVPVGTVVTEKVVIRVSA